MTARAKNRRWWRKVLLLAIGVFTLSLVVAVVIMSLAAPWAEWAWIMSCWVGLLTSGVIFLAFLGFVLGAKRPDTTGWADGLPWAVVGGVAAFMLPLSEWLWDCCYQGDNYFLACFGPLLGLMGFGIGGYLRRHTISLLIIFLAPLLGGSLAPILGETAATVLMVALIGGAIVLSLYWRMRAPAGPTYETRPGDTLADLDRWPQEAKEMLAQEPPPWLEVELSDPDARRAWLADDAEEWRSPAAVALGLIVVLVLVVTILIITL